MNASTFMKDIEQEYPNEEYTPDGLKFDLRADQKQSLAFMLRNEREPDDNHWAVGKYNSPFDHATLKIRGGVLADDVGKGKTMTSVALVLANPCPAKWNSTWSWSERRSKSKGRMKVKTTMITTSPNLMGQLYDNVTKFAPKLNVVCCHSSRSKFKRMNRKLISGKLDLSEVDVLIVSNFLDVDKTIPKVHFWRVCLDEFDQEPKRILKKCPTFKDNIW